MGRPRASLGVRRFLMAALVLVAISVLSFSLIGLAPGDAAELLARRRAGAGATAEQIAAIREQFGLNDPMVVQYGRWIADAAAGDLGISLRTNQPIGSEVGDRIFITLALTAGAGTFALGLALVVGVLGVLFSESLVDRGLRFGALIGVSIPNFWLGFLLILAFGVWLGWLPTFGYAGLSSLWLPWITLGVAFAGALSRVVRTQLAAAMAQPYMMTAEAKGLSRSNLVLFHALPNALVPSLNVAGVQLGLIFASSVVIEPVFALPGIGDWFLRGVMFRDLPAIQAGVLIYAAGFVAVTILVDVVQALIDPSLGTARA